MDPYAEIFSKLYTAGVRFVVIGVGGANYYARSGQTLFATQDSDIFVPLDSGNLVRAWSLLSEAGWDLWSGSDPLDVPRDAWLADRVVANRAAIKATNRQNLEIDLTLVMAGFSFEEAWNDRRTFQIGEMEFPVASLRQIVESKRTAGRPKDLLFLATHEEILEQLFRNRSGQAP
jgi:hypothetical protein